MERLYCSMTIDLCRRCCGTGIEPSPEGGHRPCELCEGTGVVQVEKEVTVRVTAFRPLASGGV